MNAVPSNELEQVRALAGHAPRWTTESLLEVRDWTPSLRSFRISRPAGYRFTPGHFARLGLDGPTGDILWRPFSMVSGADEPELEFVAMLVPDGEFSERLRPLTPGASIHLERFSLGFLTLDQLASGHDLWLFASGTGIGPFLSILKSPQPWERFERIVLAHSVRHATDLLYRDEIAELAGSSAHPQFHYVPVVTRETETCPEALHERLPELLTSGALQRHVGFGIEVASSRAMVCGNPELTREMRTLLAAAGFQTSRRNAPGQMAFEKYW